VGRVRRRQTDGLSQRASTLELFYDLVFVFAITQVSHLLLAHLRWAGVLQAIIVLLAVYWSWNYTTWTTNELDTETIPVRLLLLGLMLISLLMSVAIPQAFEEHALLFAGSYVAIQVGRHFFLTFVAAESGTVERERAGRILTWFVVVGVLWIASALAEGPGRYVLWLVALALDYCAPLVTYRVPGRRRLPPETWNVGTEHFAERFGLFIILALSESIVVTGATTSELDVDAARILAFVMAFLASAAFWWLYFISVAALGEHYLEVSDSRTTLARDAYT
jgi:low temperature requirement protein LtrA